MLLPINWSALACLTSPLWCPHHAPDITWLLPVGILTCGSLHQLSGVAGARAQFCSNSGGSPREALFPGFAQLRLCRNLLALCESDPPMLGNDPHHELLVPFSQ